MKRRIDPRTGSHFSNLVNRARRSRGWSVRLDLFGYSSAITSNHYTRVLALSRHTLHGGSGRIANLGLFVSLSVWLRRVLSNVNKIADLIRVLHIPNPFITKTRTKFSAVEALCLLLARFKSAGDLNDSRSEMGQALRI